MRVCILCEDKNIQAARLNCKNIFPADGEIIMDLPDFLLNKMPKTHLSTPLSATGKLPATHWFCFLSCNEETYNKIVTNALYSTIEESSPKEFLAKWGLQIIK